MDFIRRGQGLAQDLKRVSRTATIKRVQRLLVFCLIPSRIEFSNVGLTRHPKIISCITAVPQKNEKMRWLNDLNLPHGRHEKQNI